MNITEKNSTRLIEACKILNEKEVDILLSDESYNLNAGTSPLFYLGYSINPNEIDWEKYYRIFTKILNNPRFTNVNDTNYYGQSLLGHCISILRYSSTIERCALDLMGCEKYTNYGINNRTLLSSAIERGAVSIAIALMNNDKYTMINYQDSDYGKFSSFDMLNTCYTFCGSKDTKITEEECHDIMLAMVNNKYLSLETFLDNLDVISIYLEDDEMKDLVVRMLKGKKVDIDFNDLVKTTLTRDYSNPKARKVKKGLIEGLLSLEEVKLSEDFYSYFINVGRNIFRDRGRKACSLAKMEEVISLIENKFQKQIAEESIDVSKIVEISDTDCAILASSCAQIHYKERLCLEDKVPFSTINIPEEIKKSLSYDEKTGLIGPFFNRFGDDNAYYYFMHYAEFEGYRKKIEQDKDKIITKK